MFAGKYVLSPENGDATSFSGVWSMDKTKCKKDFAALPYDSF